MSRKGNSLNGKYGMLTTICKTTKRSVSNDVIWKFQCACGSTYYGRSSEVKAGRIYNCGCVTRLTHGKSATKVYRAFHKMRERCLKKYSAQWHNYGGRGIKICKRWNKFENFLLDMGEPPAMYSLDRIDNNGNYEPSNCRWASNKTQANNTRVNRYFVVNGKRYTLTQLAEKYDFNYACLRSRLKAGYTIEDALSGAKMQRKRLRSGF